MTYLTPIKLIYSNETHKYDLCNIELMNSHKFLEGHIVMLHIVRFINIVTEQYIRALVRYL